MVVFPKFSYNRSVASSRMSANIRAISRNGSREKKDLRYSPKERSGNLPPGIGGFETSCSTNMCNSLPRTLFRCVQCSHVSLPPKATPFPIRLESQMVSMHFFTLTDSYDSWGKMSFISAGGRSTASSTTAAPTIQTVTPISHNRETTGGEFSLHSPSGEENS